MRQATSDFSDADLVRALRALADPTRFRMVQEIASAGELSCGQLAERFDLSQPTVSHHLKLLADAGILVRRSEGKHHYTSVDKKLVARIAALVPSRLESPPKSRRG
ncbi:MAG TPA: metalloregulator ArsR/SmtB family transcription factor [Polyangiaceae bacterium]|jgi:ArsR family transcriptional regulator